MLCKSIYIWERINNKSVSVYRCFQTIPDNKYFIQSKDYYYMDPDTGEVNKDQKEYFDNQFLERLIDVEPEDRNYFNSLEEAIDAFEPSL